MLGLMLRVSSIRLRLWFFHNETTTLYQSPTERLGIFIYAYLQFSIFTLKFVTQIGYLLIYNDMTPHISAEYGQIAEKVIMAGDPLRAKFMAERYLENPELVNQVRGMYCYTGTYKGKRVSVMGHGMGISSIGIYTYELYNFYGVKRIIRTGSAGAYHPDLHVGDIVIAQGACDNSNFAAQYRLPGTFAPIADFNLLRAAVEKAESMGVNFRVGNILASEIFYNDDPEAWKSWQKMGVLAVEMEASALYMNAARSGNEALCICTISDSLVTHEDTTPEQREKTFTDMMEIAFEII